MGLKGETLFLMFGLIRWFIILGFTEPLHFTQTGICAVCGRQSRLSDTVSTFSNAHLLGIMNDLFNF